MTMQFINPVTITDAMLVSSTRAENDYSAWSAGTTYAAGNHCISATTHRIYESVAGGNLNHDPTTDTTHTYWLDIGPTNRWAMFDKTTGTITSQATPLAVVLDPGIINSLALLDVSATAVTVSMTDGAGGPTVYSKVSDMTDKSILLDWWMYFFSPILPKTTLVLDDLPPYTSGRVTVSIANVTTAACGTLAVGTITEIGDVQAGASFGIIDYSKKDTDAWGVTSVVARGFAKRFQTDVVVQNAAVDYVGQQLASIRATPVVWVASKDYESLIAFGWVRDWGVSIKYRTVSECRLTIEGLI